MAGVSFELKRIKTARSLKVRVYPDGRVVVSAPLRVSENFIGDFVASHAEWIETKRQKAVSELNKLTAERDKLFFRGQEFDFRLNVSRTIKPSTKIDGKTIVVTSPSEDHAEVRKLLEQFYRLYAIKVFKERVPLLADLVDSDVKTVSIRSQRTRWGSCSSHNTISLNWRLIMAPDWVSDYVIYHELAHLTHMNHSRAFWQLVERFVPNHKDARQWLKSHHNLLQF